MAQQGLAEPASPFAIDREDELPVGLQLTWRLRALIATGRLAAGEQLPSVRQLAGWADVNLNTVRGVYEGLEAEGLVVTRHGQGSFVAAGVEAHPELEEIATDALIRAFKAGLKPCEMAMVAVVCASIGSDLMGRTPADVGVADPAAAEEDGEIEVRHELRRQVARLEAELGSYARYLNRELPTAPRRAEAHVAGVGELERTRDTLIAQLSEAQRAAEQRARDEAAERLRRQRRVAARVEPGVPTAGPLARAMSWWRSKS